MASEWSQINTQNLNVESDLHVSGVLRFSNIGTLGMIPVSDANGIPTWQSPQYFVEYYQNGVVNMNGASNVLLLASATANVLNANIAYNAGVFTVPAGNYTVTFQTTPTPSLIGVSRVNFRINGIMKGSILSIPLTGYGLTLRRNYSFTDPTTIEVVSQPVVAGVVNTSDLDPSGIATTFLTIQRNSS